MNSFGDLCEPPSTFPQAHSRHTSPEITAHNVDVKIQITKLLKVDIKTPIKVIFQSTAGLRRAVVSSATVWNTHSTSLKMKHLLSNLGATEPEWIPEGRVTQCPELQIHASGLENVRVARKPTSAGFNVFAVFSLSVSTLDVC